VAVKHTSWFDSSERRKPGEDLAPGCARHTAVLSGATRRTRSAGYRTRRFARRCDARRSEEVPLQRGGGVVEYAEGAMRVEPGDSRARSAVEFRIFVERCCGRLAQATWVARYSIRGLRCMAAASPRWPRVCAVAELLVRAAGASRLTSAEKQPLRRGRTRLPRPAARPRPSVGLMTVRRHRAGPAAQEEYLGGGGCRARENTHAGPAMRVPPGIRARNRLVRWTARAGRRSLERDLLGIPGM